MNKSTAHLLGLLLPLALAVSASSAFAQTTAFHYTGFLLDGGAPASGGHDLQFTLYTAPTGGAPVAGSVTVANQPVVNGVFVVALDFGAVFDGSARWLEISARPGGSAHPFTNTFPRQAITAAPQAVFANNGVPPGTINAFGGTNVPAGWLLCDGRAVSRSTYAQLFAAVGTNWGVGDGTTTFNLPDLRGMFLRGAGTNGTKANAVGSNYTGGGLGTYQMDSFQDHQHWTVGWVNSNDTWPGGGNTYGGNNNTTVAIATRWTDKTGTMVNPNARIGTETKPASYSINYIIKF